MTTPSCRRLLVLALAGLAWLSPSAARAQSVAPLDLRVMSFNWILVRGKAEVRHAEIVTYQEQGQFPSDHFPVVAHVRF